MKTQLDSQTIADIKVTVKEIWDVDLTITQNPEAASWYFAVSKFHNELLYSKCQYLSQSTLHSWDIIKDPKPMIAFIECLINELELSIKMADEKKPEQPPKGWSWHEWDITKPIIVSETPVYTTNTPSQVTTTTPGAVFQPKYYSSIIGSTKPKVKHVPLKSLKEMYEQDAKSKPKKVKTGLSATEKVKAKKASQELAKVQAAATDKCIEEIFKPSPFFQYMKDFKLTQSGGTQIQAPLKYIDDEDEIKDYYQVLSEEKSLQEKLLGEVPQKFQNAPWLNEKGTEAEEAKGGDELKHKVKCSKSNKNPQKP